jgi:DNA-3-methyladenine glycosylase I
MIARLLDFSYLPRTMTYCEYIENLPAGAKRELHKNYHDNHYGFPLHDDNELFGRLLLEINQAGLNWEIILRKEPAFRKAFSDYNVKKIAAYNDKDRNRLMNDEGIIRNRLKINAAIENAKVILELQKEYGSFSKWLEHHHPLTLAEWVKLFKKTFKFTGGEIVNEFMMSIGFLPGTHDESCPVYKKIMKEKPMWMV